MTCQELHTHFENLDIELLPDDEATEHITGCAHCTRFVEEQEELRKHLRLVRDSAPLIPSSLDDAVLANYRKAMLVRSSSGKSTSLMRRIDLRTALGWASAVAFAAVVAGAALLLFDPQQQIPQQQANQEIVAHQPRIFPAQRTDEPHKSSRKAPKSRRNSDRHSNDPELSAEQNALLPTEFESLMYCDQISCPGALEVIRVQLSSPVLGSAPRPRPADNAVFADVVVGPDGIARGIRVVE